MKYSIQINNTHPLGADGEVRLELFRINISDRRWVRDDKYGKRWGFEHPISKEVVHIWSAGVGPAPILGKVTDAFTIEAESAPLDEETEAYLAEAVWAPDAFTIEAKPVLFEDSISDYLDYLEEEE
jgi:hypothetical protein